MVVWNHSAATIFIVTKWKADNFGGAALREETTAIRPGGGIDLDVIGLKTERPVDPGKKQGFR